MLLCQQSPSSQSYGFSSSHVWMWELDWKERWALKNICFWTMVLEKTWESLCKEIQPVYPKGNQSWIFIGRTDAEAELQYFGHLMWSRPTGTDPDAGRDWREKEEGGSRRWDGWMASPSQRTWIWANSGRYRKTGKTGVLQSTGSQSVRHNWATEQQKQQLLLLL